MIGPRATTRDMSSQERKRLSCWGRAVKCRGLRIFFTPVSDMGSCSYTPTWAGLFESRLNHGPNPNPMVDHQFSHLSIYLVYMHHFLGKKPHRVSHRVFHSSLGRDPTARHRKLEDSKGGAGGHFSRYSQTNRSESMTSIIGLPRIIVCAK